MGKDKDKNALSYFRTPKNISINIADQLIVVTVSSEEEEEAVRAGAREADYLYQAYKKRFSKHSDATVWIYVCLHLGRLYHMAQKDVKEVDTVLDELQQLNERLKSEMQTDID